MGNAGSYTGLGHRDDLSLTCCFVQRRRERFNRRQAGQTLHTARPTDLKERLAHNAALALLGIGGLHVLERRPLGEAGSERRLIQTRQRGGELLHPSYQRVATATRDFPLPLEEQLVHLPELALQPGAGGGLSSTDTALAKVEHGTEDKLHLPLAHVFIYDDRFYRYDVAGTEWSQEVRVVGQRDRRIGRA